MEEELLVLPETASADEVITRLAEGRPRLAKVLSCSSLLVDGVRLTEPSMVIGGAAQLDVLPPFAGG